MINTERLKKHYHEMIRINSISGNEKEIGEYISKRIEEIGLEPKMIYFEEEKQRPSVYTSIKSEKEGPSILLIGHIDTVDITGKWDTDPFEPVEIGDKTYGRGSMDMKGGLSAIIETLYYFKKNPDKFTGEIIAAFVSDEEVLAKGTYRLIEEDISPDMAIMAECRFDNAAVGFRGRYSIIIDVEGVAAHSSKYPKLGENAIISAGKLAGEIESLPTVKHPKLGTGTWCVKHIEGGIQNALIVPNKCRITLERFFVEGENYESIEKQIYEAAEKLGIKEKTKVKLKERTMPYMEPFTIPEDHKLVTALKDKYKEVTGKEIRLEYDPSVCDSNILVNSANIPTITFGPSGENMHGENEFGYFKQVEQSTQIYIKTLEELLK